MSGRTVSLLVLVGTLSAAGPGQQPSFAPPRYVHSLFPIATDIAVADLDRDGRVDVLAPRHSLSIGPATCSFFSMLLDDDGGCCARADSGPPQGPLALNGTVRTAAADFDGDGWTDVVSLSDAAALTLFLNRQHGALHNGLAAGTLIESMAARYPVAFPLRLLPTALLAADFDADGRQDLLFAGNIVNSYAGTQNSTGINIWFGRGDGSFDAAAVFALQSQAAPLDVRWVDWDGVGGADTLLVLGEIRLSPFSVSPTLEQFRLQPASRSLAPFGRPQVLGLAASRNASTVHPTAIDFAPAAPPWPRHYVVSGYSVLQADCSPELWVADVAANGDLMLPGLVPVNLPTSMFGASSSELQAAHTGDFDGDGQLDAVALHLQGYNATGPQLPAGLVFVRGPLAPGNTSPVTVVTLAGTLGELLNPTSMIGSGPAWIPNVVAPSAIAVHSVTASAVPDLMVSGLRVPAPGNPSSWISAIAVLKNASTVAPGVHGGIRSVSGCRPLPGGGTARCGSTGGPPRPGNADFAITLTRGPRNATVALHAGYDFVQFTLPIGPGAGLPFGTVFVEHSQLMSLQAPQYGQGVCVAPLPIPAHPAMLGVTAFFGWTLLDHESRDAVPVYNSDTMQVTVW